MNAADKLNEMFAAGSALEECKDSLLHVREKFKAEAGAVAAQAASARRSLTAVDLRLTKAFAATGMSTSFRSVLTLMKCCEPIQGGYVQSQCVKVTVWKPSVGDVAGPLVWTALLGEPSVRAIRKVSGQCVCARCCGGVSDRPGRTNDQRQMC